MGKLVAVRGKQTLETPFEAAVCEAGEVKDIDKQHQCSELE